MANINHPKKELRKDTTMLIILCLSIIFSITLAFRTITPLDYEEHISVERGVLLFMLGVLFFTSLFNFFNNVGLRTTYGTKLRKQYQLSVSDVLDISNKLVSMVQAIFSCLTGAMVCMYSCQRNFLRTNHYSSEGYAWFGCSYFFYDIWSMYRYHTSLATTNAAQTGFMNGEPRNKGSALSKFGTYLKQQPLMVAHHVFIGSFGFLVIVYLRGGLGDCVFGYCYLMELSTPFVSLRGILSRLGQKSSRLYVINGMLMLATFFLCRIAMFPYVMYLYARSVHLDYISSILTLPTGCMFSITILVLPQFYWFYLMLKGATQIMCVPKPGAASVPNGGKSVLQAPPPSGVQQAGPRKRRYINYHHQTVNS